MQDSKVPPVATLFDVAGQYHRSRSNSSKDRPLQHPYHPEQQVRRFRSYCEQQRRYEEAGAYSLLMAANALANSQSAPNSPQPQRWGEMGLLNCTQNVTHVVTSNDEGITGWTVSEAQHYTLGAPQRHGSTGVLECSVTQTISYSVSPQSGSEST